MTPFQKTVTPLSNSKWNVGDCLDISENQKSLLNDPKAVSILNPITVPYKPLEDLIEDIRKFLGYYPQLCVRYLKKEHGIVQQLVTASEVFMEIRYREVTEGESHEALREEGITFLKSECDFFKGELIRLMVFREESNPQELVVVLGIHYSLIDMHSNMILSDSLQKFLFNEPIDTDYLTSFAYTEW
jgi:hypothetical protein